MVRLAFALWFGVLGMVAMGSAQAQTAPQPELPKDRLVIETKDGARHAFDVEMALAPEQQTIGLMFRTVVPEDGGMLFVWPAPQNSQMWMRNTVSSLDMVFINPDGRVRRVVENTVPQSLAIIESGGPVKATLELRAGITRKLGIHAGDRVIHPIFGAAP